MRKDSYIDMHTICNTDSKEVRRSRYRVLLPFSLAILNITKIWKFAYKLVMPIYVGNWELAFRENHMQKIAKVNPKTLHI